MSAEVNRKVGRPPRPPEPRTAEPHECQEFADRLQVIVDALEIGDLPKDVRLFLQKEIRRCDLLRSVDAKRFPAKGDEQVTILLRTVFESQNGAAALTVPILRAVSYCMESRWVDRGLEWIEAFDSIGLVELLERIRALDYCDEGDLEKHLCQAVRRRLVRRFGPPKIAVVPKKPPVRPKTARPPGISAETRNDVLALRKKSNRPKAARMAA